MKNWVFIIITLLVGIGSISAEELCVVSYNVENLFHPKHDTVFERVSELGNEGMSELGNEGMRVSELGNEGMRVSELGNEGMRVSEKDDQEWTPEGERRWSYSRYYRKVENIARVLTNIGEWPGVDIVGLQEVENALCVKRLCNTLRRGEYSFVHYESPDRRGIDVALIYKKARVDTLSTKAIRVKTNPDPTRFDCPLDTLRLKGRELITRDILYVCARVDKRDTIHVFVCHLPSQRGGKAESEWKRKAAKQVLQQAVDSVFKTDPNAKIIVMGDMNSEPLEDLNGLTNRMRKPTPNPSLQGRENIYGTHKYQGQWTCLDQFYVSPAVDSISKVRIYDEEWIQETDEKYMGLKPKRTYNGFRYQNGFSDHLPIILTIKSE